MEQLIKKLEKHLDKLSQRDQISLLVIFLVVVMMIWSHLFYLPLSENMIVAQQNLHQKQLDIEDLQMKMIILQKNINADPDAVNRRQLEEYVEEKILLDKALAKTASEIVNPQEMVSLMKRLLTTQTELKFVSLKNSPATPEFVKSLSESELEAEAETAVKIVDTIYRHSVILTMEGGYHEALSYLKEIELLPWRFFWQSIEIETSNYPNISITLEVYTLGLREGLIGV